MANTKLTILNALVTGLAGLSVNGDGVTATRELLPPDDQRNNAPYVGVVSQSEVRQAEDSTHILYDMQVDLVMVAERGWCEKFIDVVRDYVAGPPSLGQKFLSIEQVQPVSDIRDDAYSETRVTCRVFYSSEKGAEG